MREACTRDVTRAVTATPGGLAGPTGRRKDSRAGPTATVTVTDSEPPTRRHGAHGLGQDMRGLAAPGRLGHDDSGQVRISEIDAEPGL